ncbi:MAG: trigger factor [Kiritimatiellia bacterium]
MSDIQVKSENAGPCRKALTIVVPASDVDTQYRKLLDLYSKSARIPGFRPGKAPGTLVEKHYGKEIRSEMKDYLLAHGYRSAMDQEKIRPVAAVDVTDESPVLAGAPFSFKVTVDLPPTFELPVYKGIAIAPQAVEVTDAQVEESIQQLRDRMARYNEVRERPVQAGDIVKIDYQGVCEGKPVGELAPGCAGIGDGKDFWLRTDAAGDADFLPGAAQAVAGMENGSTRETPIAFPAEYHVKELAGKTATYTITVKEVREKLMPEMDEDFYKMTGAANRDDLVTKIRENLMRGAQRAEDSRRLEAASRFLLENTKIDELPQTEVQNETQQIVMNIVRENTLRGVTSDIIKDQRDSIMNAATRSSEERVKLSHILDRIAEAEKIEVQEADVKSAVAMLAARQRQSPEKLREELEKDGRINHLVRDMRNEKALAFVVKNAAGTDVATA